MSGDPARRQSVQRLQAGRDRCFLHGYLLTAIANGAVTHVHCDTRRHTSVSLQPSILLLHPLNRLEDHAPLLLRFDRFQAQPGCPAQV
jgi:hypothetical protein